MQNIQSSLIMQNILFVRIAKKENFASADLHLSTIHTSRIAQEIPRYAKHTTRII